MQLSSVILTEKEQTSKNRAIKLSEVSLSLLCLLDNYNGQTDHNYQLGIIVKFCRKQSKKSKNLSYFYAENFMKHE